jgi:hypothetical protein
MMFHIPNYHFYRTDREDGQIGVIAVAVKKGISHTCVDLPPFLLVKAKSICIPIRSTEMLLAAVYKSHQRLWSDNRHLAVHSGR